MTPPALASDGFLTISAALPAATLAQIAAQPGIADESDSDAGTRNLLTQSWCRALAAVLRERLLDAKVLQADNAAVQCTLFRKSHATNWKVALHQDLSIPVAQRVEHPQLQAWSKKEGGHFVQPPVALLQRLMAVRLHVDPCGPGDGPLRVIPGSHRHGKLDAAHAAALRQEYGETECTAQPGDLLIMQPLLLHASSKAIEPSGRRRVLHFLFGPHDPGFGLRWSTAI
ncbi:phytanoyl-CoA dioxygenase family protein [Lysobacter gummosus]|uniref:Phytanoyl-CoA dioxygenase family protein n=1 Tax=Lysobacter gummosus TaxID=262324 RepID=A0ABY3XHS3_9GAMM|nr:phytanoyl-CoA dioxygenase family protein [Lysobacter gummosus]ALN90682.1 phytanoyl-CoA dioxygenase family protein [Lysobacter gummosus]UNP31167.1 phytanoyl-CoA dioxygenase family protein [Lysobacter gummosus]